MTHVFDELQWRGLVYDSTEGAADLLANNKISLYTGFDPTAASLHVGHFVPMLGLARMQRFGHTPIALAGGGTGLIGDPSGRSSERQLLSQEQIEANVAGIQKQLASILDFESKTNPAQIVNNVDWLGKMSMLDFLRDVGKHFTINYMMAKDSVKNRLEREDGLSFTEFSYMLLQSYDFYQLHKTHNCVLQAGGSDQWGNIVAGSELIRRKTEGSKVHGLVYPLITKADGTKFGKTGTGTVWLDPELTSPYQFYQFWLNTTDADVVSYLKFFTWLSQEDIEALAHAVEERPGQREAQKRLAVEVTELVHGKTAVDNAQKAAQVLFGGDMDGLSAKEIQDIFADVPSSEVTHDQLGGEGMGLLDLLVHTGATKSKGEARRAVQGGGVYLNNQRIGEIDRNVRNDDAIEGQFLVVRKGKKRYYLVKVLR